VSEDRIHPLPIEPGEFVAAHLAVGKREFAMVRVASDMADVGDVVRLVSQHELHDFTWEHQPLVKRGVAGITLR
jgi:hypothetical protein